MRADSPSQIDFRVTNSRSNLGEYTGAITLTDVLEVIAGDAPEPERRRHDGE
ncbi:hypothetical protein [Paraburkholderia sp. J12]|uniref:hypothetical protein n=1 Tax=Paraburkholderia sp. J12 TaxID=2805432 RepID=UPI002ABDE0BA|nr:hypothetical protein [Paraburkholderia sp. J12]